MALSPVTTTDAFLAQISDQLTELVGILRPEPPAEPEAPADAPAEPAKKAPVKKATTRKVTGQ